MPALTTSLRGIVNCFVEVRTLDHPVHSGMYGGAVPDALTALAKLLATLHDDAGDVAVAGLAGRDRRRASTTRPTGCGPKPDSPTASRFIGTGRLTDRIWTKPALAVLGIDAPSTAEAPNALVPAAKAKLSVRLAPGDDATSAYAALVAHLEKHAPWGAQVTVTLEHDGQPCVIDTSGPMFDAARAAFRAAWDGTAPGRGRHRRLDPVHRHLPGDVPAARRSSSPASRIPTRGPTGRTRACTWASSPGSASPRPCSWPRWPAPAGPPADESTPAPVRSGDACGGTACAGREPVRGRGLPRKKPVGGHGAPGRKWAKAGVDARRFR